MLTVVKSDATTLPILDPVSQFAQLLQQARMRRRMTLAQCARALGIKQEEVWEYEQGRKVPPPTTWYRYKTDVDGHLTSFNIPYRHALKAAGMLDEDGDIKKPEKPAREIPKIATNVGEQLKKAIEAKETPPEPRSQAVVLPPVPEPEPEKIEATPMPMPMPTAPTLEPKPEPTTMPKQNRRSNPKVSEALLSLPKGWRNQDRIEERRVYARELMLRDPDQGLDAIIDKVKAKFKAGVSYPWCIEERKKIKRALAKAESKGTTIPQTAKKPLALPSPKVNGTPKVNGHNDVNEQVRAAIELMLESVPSLKELRLERDENGKPAVSFTLETVVTSSGSLKL